MAAPRQYGVYQKMFETVEAMTRYKVHGVRSLAAAALSLLLLGCSDSQPDNVPGSRDDPALLELRGAQIKPKLAERAPQPAQAISGDVSPVVGEVPQEVLDVVLKALEKLTGASRDSFESVQATAVNWPDGALGCPQPGMHYTQAPVTGYQVVVRHNGRDYDYRVGGTSYLLLCLEPGQQIPSGSATPVQ